MDSAALGVAVVQASQADYSAPGGTRPLGCTECGTGPGAPEALAYRGLASSPILPGCRLIAGRTQQRLAGGAWYVVGETERYYCLPEAAVAVSAAASTVKL